MRAEIPYGPLTYHDMMWMKACDYNLLRGVEWVHGLFLFPLVLGKM